PRGRGGRRDHRRGIGGVSHAGSRARDARAESGRERRRRPAVSPVQSTSRIRVRYAETDQMGVVYYANYFVWFEVARTDLLRASGSTYREMEAEGFSLPVIEAHCGFKQPARYDDELEIRVEAELPSPA